MINRKTFDDTRIDADGLREVVLIGNENPGGCPFKCKACGVSYEAEIVSSSANWVLITEQLANLYDKLRKNLFYYMELDYHLLIYNFGNIVNPDELSIENFDHLLNEIGKLPLLPKYVSLNSRGRFINKGLLSLIGEKKLKFGVNFIFGIETMTEKGILIYGKGNIKQEFQVMFDIIRSYNIEYHSTFGIDVGFVFLPEFYTDDRTDKAAIINGFENDLGSFISLYAGRNVPIKISVHPYYNTQNSPYQSTYDYLDIITDVMIEKCKAINFINKKLEVNEQCSIFLGLKDSGYKSENWQRAINKYQKDIDRINKYSENENQQR